MLLLPQLSGLQQQMYLCRWFAVETVVMICGSRREIGVGKTMKLRAPLHVVLRKRDEYKQQDMLFAVNYSEPYSAICTNPSEYVVLHKQCRSGIKQVRCKSVSLSLKWLVSRL